MDNEKFITGTFIAPFYSKQTNPKLLSRYVLSYIQDSISQSQPFLQNLITSTILFMYIGRLDHPFIQACIGISLTCYFFIYIAGTGANYEVLGIQCSKIFGGQKHSQLTTVLLQGLTQQLCIFVFTSLIFWYSESILAFIGFSLTNSHECSKILRALLPSVFLNSLNSQLESFYVSQNFNRPFGIANFMLILVNLCLGYLLVIQYNFGIYAQPICKLFNEVVILCLCLIIWIIKIDYRVKCWPNFFIYKKNLSEYIWNGFKIIAANYIEYLGFELNTYWIGMTHDDIQIAAFVSWSNLAAIIFTIGIAFGIVSRTNAGHLVGGGKSLEAKNQIGFGLFVTTLIGCVFCLGFAVFNQKLALIYTSLDEVCSMLQEAIFIYAFCIILEFSNGSLCCVLRMADKINELFYSKFLCQVVLQGPLSYYLCLSMEFGISGLMYSFQCCSTILDLVLLYLVWSIIDWEVDLKVSDEEDKEIDEKQHKFDIHLELLNKN